MVDFGDGVLFGHFEHSVDGVFVDGTLEVDDLFVGAEFM